MTPKGEALAKLEAIGLEAICERIEEGDSQADIAKELGISKATLSTWLNKPENAERSAHAREISAESWLDRGLARVDEACYKTSGIDASAAKAFAQECARRAALRNPRYVERTAHEVSGPGGKPIELTHTVSAATLSLLEDLSRVGADSVSSAPVQN